MDYNHDNSFYASFLDVARDVDAYDENADNSASLDGSSDVDIAAEQVGCKLKRLNNLSCMVNCTKMLIMPA